MFIVMNCFQVKKGVEVVFEVVWVICEFYFGSMVGFVEFYLLKGLEVEDYMFYLLYIFWVDKVVFEVWICFEEFCCVYVCVDNQIGESLYFGYFKFEGFEVIQSECKVVVV